MNESCKILWVLDGTVTGGLESNVALLAKDNGCDCNDFFILNPDSDFGNKFFQGAVDNSFITGVRIDYSRHESILKKAIKLLLNLPSILANNFVFAKHAKKYDVIIVNGFKPIFSCLFVLYFFKHTNIIFVLHDSMVRKLEGKIINVLLKLGKARVLSVAPQVYIQSDFLELYYEFRETEASKSRSKKRKFIMIGNIHPNKQQHLLVQLAVSKRDTSFEVFGAIMDEHYFEYIQNEIKKYAVENIIFRGFCSKDEIYQNVTGVLNFSLTEGQPVTFFEALERGIPFLSLGGGYTKKMIAQFGGVYCNSSDIEDISNALKRLEQVEVPAVHSLYESKGKYVHDKFIKIRQ